jgi:ribosomal protein S18 acetylase RimI-like enzyme
MTDDQKLDNPVWHSLSEYHQTFAIGSGDIKFYLPDLCPFGGFIGASNSVEFIAQYALLVDNFFIVGERPTFPELLQLKKELVCLQMIADQKVSIDNKEKIVKLGEDDRNELLHLVNLVQPGYFKKDTFLLGDYYGIFKNNRLVAVTGERMKMNAFTEVSAVVTHPDHTGRGYAGQLVAYTMNAVFDQNKIPYLHVTVTNTGAIRLYERLGFRVRRKISFWNLEKTGGNGY